MFFKRFKDWSEKKLEERRNRTPEEMAASTEKIQNACKIVQGAGAIGVSLIGIVGAISAIKNANK